MAAGEREYWSDRYGDLASIAPTTRGRCHLCHEPADLALYGRTGLFGADTRTVTLPRDTGELRVTRECDRRPSHFANARNSAQSPRRRRLGTRLA
jgi:hypothetical protein